MNIMKEFSGYGGHPGGGCIDVMDIKLKPDFLMVRKHELNTVNDMAHLISNMVDRADKAASENLMASTVDIIDQIKQELQRLMKCLEQVEV